MAVRDRSHCLLGLGLCCILASCSDPDCPDGFDKVGNSCRRHDAGTDATIDPVSAGDDAASNGPIDAATAEEASAPKPGDPVDAGTTVTDSAVLTPGVDSGGDSDECNGLRRCPNGYACEGGKCISACSRKQCDPNATCSLSGDSALCTCNSGFVSMSGPLGVTCARDIACEELGCSPNASCEIGPDKLRQCVCKPGSGPAPACNPILCPALPEPDYGTVLAPGRALGQSANYICDTGYDIGSGSRIRTCQDDGQGNAAWSGSAGICVIKCTIDDSCALGETCVSNPDCGSGNVCENGHCLLGSCAGGEFTSADSLRYCKTINGDLKITLTASGPAQFEMPNTTEVLGNIAIAAKEVIPGRRVVTLSALTHVAGILDVGATSVGSSPTVAVFEANFPKLTNIDLHLRVQFSQALRVLALPTLSAVGGSVYFQYLDYLHTLQLGALQSVGNEMQVLLVPNIGYSPVFSRLAGILGSRMSLQGLGCCFASNGSPDCPSRTPPTTCM